MSNDSTALAEFDKLLAEATGGDDWSENVIGMAGDLLSSMDDYDWQTIKYTWKTREIEWQERLVETLVYVEKDRAIPLLIQMLGTTDDLTATIADSLAAFDRRSLSEALTPRMRDYLTSVAARVERIQALGIDQLLRRVA